MKEEKSISLKEMEVEIKKIGNSIRKQITEWTGYDPAVLVNEELQKRSTSH